VDINEAKSYQIFQLPVMADTSALCFMPFYVHTSISILLNFKRRFFFFKEKRKIILSQSDREVKTSRAKPEIEGNAKEKEKG